MNKPSRRRWRRAAVAVAAAAAAVAAALAVTTAASDSAATAGATSGTTSGVVTVNCADATTDASTLQTAINASAPGSVILIQGTCLLTSGITLSADRTYDGGNDGNTTLKQDAGMGYVLASSAYVNDRTTTGGPVTIRNLRVECDGSGSTVGIMVLNWLADVEHNYVSDCGGSGIVDTSTNAAGATITNSSVNSRFDNNFITHSGQDGFEVLDSGNAVTDGYLEDNQIALSGQDAIDLQNAAGWDISGNHVYGDGEGGISANRMYSTTISGNIVEDFGAAQTSGTWYGIVGTAQGGVGSVISGNKVENLHGVQSGTRHIYIAVTRTNYGTSYVSVTGNVIVGTTQPGDTGFYFSGGGHALSVASSGNEVSLVATPRTVTSSATLTSGI